MCVNSLLLCWEGGWGSIEYGTPVKGQSIGGRWKPLQHLLRRSVFATVGAACLDDGRCYVRNDGKTAFSGSLRLTLTELATGAVAWSSTVPLSIARGAHAVQWVCVKGSSTPATNCTSWATILTDARCTRATCVFNADVLGPADTAAAANTIADTPPLSSNQQLLLPPGELKVVADAVVTATIGTARADGQIPVTVKATATALLVTLTTLAHGMFSDNVFLLTQHAPMELLFTPYGPVDEAALRASLRVVHLAQYL
jgi:beta-mannosidase